ncbi:hypothetical protein LCGC14_0493050 [marine sediment metagenome]|uniref:CRISPR system ring nuclease SSO1393-like domain-containing protein n=1 Tax=marine sediment metagenome TaxID=412755 RepID=A0A0F9SPG1_9ZZZZ|nr:hypothetical protein [archaeon]
MDKRTCQIVLVGHTWQKLIYSIDKEIFDKLILIIEKENLPGTQEAEETLEILIEEYKKRKINVEYRQFNFHIPTKPIAEMTYLIYQQKILGFSNIIINISGGLRYMNIWIYIAASITKSRIIHGNFIYNENIEVGIHKNDDLDTLYFSSLTSKQLEFMKLFFNRSKNALDFFRLDFNENLLLRVPKSYNSIEEIKLSLNKQRGKKLTRGAINGYIMKLNRISALVITPEDQNKKSITISYIGIAFFLKAIFKLINEIKP